jgi:DNA-binding CsgD family transcriptional regulator
VGLTGNPGIVGKASYGELFIKAWRGCETEARTAAAQTVRDSLERGQGAGLMFVQFALAMLELGLGHFPAALASARALYDDDALYMGTHALPIMVEAAVKAGDPAAAGLALGRLAARAEASGTQLALGLLARCRALMDDDEPLYREAIDRVARTRATLELARCHLLYGEWLREQGRDDPAEEQLDLAHAMFVEMGALAFAARAVAGRPGSTAAVALAGDPLTERELGVLRLLATNLTVPEIAGQLFVSTNTVKTHTKRIYRKLGAHRRSEAVDRARALGLLSRRAVRG